MIEDLKIQIVEKMNKAVEYLSIELAKIRTGRAHPSVLDHVRVQAYGTKSALSQVANVSVLDARTLSVHPWDNNLLSAIEKGIREADDYLNPSVIGKSLRVPLPPLSEERRKSLVKLVRQEGESARVQVRNVRRDANNSLKDAIKKKLISIDDERRSQDEFQKKTDSCMISIDQFLEDKETELMTM